MIVDLPNSSVAAAVAAIGWEKHKPIMTLRSHRPRVHSI